MKPATQYTKSGHINIAYQVFGKGPIDLVYIPGWVSNIDLMWECPELVDFLKELGKIARVILFDKRGTGLSDRVVELSTLEERMDDIRAVMDAVDSEKAVLFGHSEGGSVSALFAATYPNRVISLIAFGIFAKRRWSPDYPWAPTDEERQKVYDMIDNSWGSGEMNLESLAPSKANDRVFMNWLANYFRSGASPSAAMALTKMNTEVDIIDILGSVKVPTLLIQRTHDIDVKVEEGKFIAERIEGARFEEFPGSDHLFWAGNTREILDEMKAFILNVKPQRRYEERLFTIVAGELKDASVMIESTLELVNQIVEQYRGSLIVSEEDSFVATFEGSSKAVHCSLDLISLFKDQGSDLSVGIHIREVPVSESHLIYNETRQFNRAILSAAKPGELLVTQPIKYLLSGAGLKFGSTKSITHPVLDSEHLLIEVSDQIESRPAKSKSLQNYSSKKGSLLETVLEVIEENMNQAAFGVDFLCKEVGMSERQLQRKLKAITNKSPVQLISSVRLYKAKEMLMADNLNISEVAFQTGFSSPSYFSKCFKQEFGINPSEYQKQN